VKLPAGTPRSVGEIRDGDILGARIDRIGRRRMAVTRLAIGRAAGTANGEVSR